MGIDLVNYTSFFYNHFYSHCLVWFKLVRKRMKLFYLSTSWELWVICWQKTHPILSYDTIQTGKRWKVRRFWAWKCAFFYTGKENFSKENWSRHNLLLSKKNFSDKKELFSQMYKAHFNKHRNAVFSIVCLSRYEKKLVNRTGSFVRQVLFIRKII